MLPLSKKIAFLSSKPDIYMSQINLMICLENNGRSFADHVFIDNKSISTKKRGNKKYSEAVDIWLNLSNS